MLQLLQVRLPQVPGFPPGLSRIPGPKTCFVVAKDLPNALAATLGDRPLQVAMSIATKAALLVPTLPGGIPGVFGLARSFSLTVLKGNRPLHALAVFWSVDRFLRALFCLSVNGYGTLLL